ncbi:copper resistance protein CopD [Actinoplanes sp. ATCC 53533]|uniref:cytochrome c oxidase assembly protein n=1 Tax=Actinoplanes sp. ATCC 53533 TaxID=1288362 RepID=UPI000F7715BE|nr:cytochrome c oxidase assembly protein [Actinoplanes sp. ATCC 53533]RSM42891.1 copper resistance protein CopD [Actinoplanes sp. ATCC 53533]
MTRPPLSRLRRGKSLSSSGRALKHVALAVSAVLVSVSILVLALRYGGGVAREALPGLPDPGLAPWLLPVARLGAHLAAIATVGLLLAAVVLSPRDQGRVSVTAYRRLRAVRWTALAWLLCTGAALCLTLADLTGVAMSDIVSFDTIVNFATTVPLGRALALTAILAGVVAVVCATTVSVPGMVIALVAAIAALLPPLFTGHAAAGGNHQLAISALVLHVVPVTLWAGGLLALLLSGRGTADSTHAAVQRFSALATWCLAAVTLSGLASTTVRIPDVAMVFTTRYGQLVLIKGALLAGLGALGWQQRRAALPALRSGNRRRFTALAAAEILIFAAAMGTAAALSRTPPPGTQAEETPAQALLGFPMPDPLTVGRLAGNWLPEPLYLTAAVCAAGLYVAGFLRLRRRGDAWPVSRTVLFVAGCALLIVTTSSGMARYAQVLFSVHMAQHLVLNMVVPILLVLAAPVTLALRALPPARDPSWPGPREWLHSALHSRLLRTASHPVIALSLYVGSLYAMYFTGLYELALRSHVAHLAMVGHFLLTGYLFFWVVIGVDPSPRRVPYPLRIVMIFAAMVFHAFLGVTLMMSNTPLALDWFTSLARPWGPTPTDDVRLGGGMAWSFGELPMAVVLAALLRQWMHADEREARRRDRAADRAEAEGREDADLTAYNAMLTELADRDRRRMR